MAWGKKEFLIVAGAAVVWYLFRETVAGGKLGSKWNDATGQTYAVSDQQRAMLAAQDAAFSYSGSFETAPFHGNAVI